MSKAKAIFRKSNLSTLVRHWLPKLDIVVTKEFIYERLNAHPDYPSLASVTDFLDDLGVDNGAYVVDKARWDELPFPFLAYTTRFGGKYLVIDKEDKHLLGQEDSLEDWDGIGIFAEKKQVALHNTWKDKVREEKAAEKKWVAIFLGGIFLAVLAGAFPYSILTVASMLLTVAGLGVSILIVRTELGWPSELTEKICGVQATSGCNSLLHSKASKVFGSLKWSDIGIIYFGSFLVLQVSRVPVISLLALASLPFSVFSVYYQYRIAKKWCTLCLLVVSTICLQVLVQYPALTIALPSLQVLGATLFFFSGIAIVWLGLLKPSLLKINELTAARYSLQRFKFNQQMFRSLLTQQKKVITESFEGDIQLGEPQAEVQIMVACNPYCMPCAKAHAVLEELLQEKSIGLTIRFAVTSLDISDKRTAAVARILQAAGLEPAKRRRVLHDWYELMDAGKFNLKYPVTDPDESVQSLIIEHKKWSEISAIEYTPSIFINGHQLPPQYKVEDLRYIVGR